MKSIFYRQPAPSRFTVDALIMLEVLRGRIANTPIIERPDLAERMPPMLREAGVRVYMMNGCRILVTHEPGGWHLSISRHDRDPTWAEIATARYRLLPEVLNMAMFLPPLAEYVNLHPYTFHLYESPQSSAEGAGGCEMTDDTARAPAADADAELCKRLRADAAGWGLAIDATVSARTTANIEHEAAARIEVLAAHCTNWYNAFRAAETKAERAEAELQRERKDAERYRILRLYKLSGVWPREIEPQPRLLGWGGSHAGEPYRCEVIDKMMDDELESKYSRPAIDVAIARAKRAKE